MRFSKILSVAALAAPALATLTASDIVKNINTLTFKSRNLQTPASQINLVNGALAIIGQGPVPQVIVGFTDIINTATADIYAMDGAPPFTVKADEDAIYTALVSFVQVHQQLLNILIGKSGIIENIAFGPPVAAVLRSLESVVDNIAFSIIDTIPDRKDDATVQINSLDQTISTAINKYSEI